jgi:hypothetical protein
MRFDGYLKVGFSTWLKLPKKSETESNAAENFALCKKKYVCRRVVAKNALFQFFSFLHFGKMKFSVHC